MSSIQWDGRRGGDLATRGRWISLEDATEFVLTKEERDDPSFEVVDHEWWKTDFVRAIQHDPTGPVDKPIWNFENGDMYLGEWKAEGPKGHSVEHGRGIIYNHFPRKIRGLIYKGEFSDGHCHGHGETFWLENSKSWTDNHLPGSKITRIYEETGQPRGIPFCYKGNYNNDVKTDPKAVYTLKDGTTHVGPWKHNEPVVAAATAPANAPAARPSAPRANSGDSDASSTQGKDQRKPKKQKRRPAKVTPEANRRATCPQRRQAEDVDDEVSEESEWQPGDKMEGDAFLGKNKASSKRKKAPESAVPGRVDIKEEGQGSSDNGDNSKKRKKAPVPDGGSKKIARKNVDIKEEEQDDANDGTNSKTNRKKAPERRQRSNMYNRKQPPNIICLDDSDDDEPARSNGATAATAMTQGADYRQQRQMRVEQIAAYIASDIVGSNPNPGTMARYAEHLHDEGYESVELITAHLDREDIEAFDWMAKLHKKLFVRKFS